MKVDEIYNLIGDFGKYQIISLVLLYGTLALSSIQAFSAVFINAVPDFRCAVNDEDTVYIPNDESKGSVDLWIPRQKEYPNLYESCRIYQHEVNWSNPSREIAGCSNYVYSTAYFTRTVVSEFDLVCENHYLNSLSISIFMTGMLLGSTMGGLVSDAWGRKKALISSITVEATFSILTYFAQGYASFAFCRFFIGFGEGSMYVVVVVLGMESVGPAQRTAAGTGVGVAYAIGVMFLSPLAYYIRDWRYLMLTVGLVQCIFVIYVWAIPESLHWLIGKNKMAESQIYVDKISERNGVKLHIDVLSQVGKEPNHTRESAFAIFSAPGLLIKTAILAYGWSIITLAYYTTTLSSGNFGDIYISYLLSALVEVPGHGFIFVSNIFGRKKTGVVGILSCGILSLVVGCLILCVEKDQYGWKFVILQTILKFGLTLTYFLIYIWGTEIFPTPLRTTLVGVCAAISSGCSVCAPFLAGLPHYIPGKIGLALPSVIIGAMMLTTALLSSLLPETANRPFPETIQEANTWYMSSRVSDPTESTDLIISTAALYKKKQACN